MPNRQNDGVTEMIQENTEAHSTEQNPQTVEQRKKSAQRIAGKYHYPHGTSAATSMTQALAERIRLQVERSEATLREAGADGHTWYGRPQDCLSVCGNIAHLARENQLLLLDILASNLAPSQAFSEGRMQRLETKEATWEFLLARETDSPEQALSRLKNVNEELAQVIEQLSDKDLDTEIDTYLYNRQRLRDLLLIIIEQGSFNMGQAWGILKLQRNASLK